MKTRQGFVSNSSSSSFIVDRNITNSELKIDIIYDRFDAHTNLSIEEIFFDIKKDIKHYDTVNNIEQKQERLYDTAYSLIDNMICYYLDSITTNHSYNINYYEIYYKESPYKFTDDEKTLIKSFGELYSKEYNESGHRDFVENKAKQISKEWFDKDYVYLSYSDEDGCWGCFYEHTVMPTLQQLTNCVICTISNH